MADAPHGPCNYCSGRGARRGGAEDGLAEPLYVCDRCFALLKNPATALALIRGDASLELRGVVPEPQAKRMVDLLIAGLQRLRPRG